MRDDHQWGAVNAGLEDNSWLARKQQAAAAYKRKLSTLARIGTRLLPVSVVRRLLACFSPLVGWLAQTICQASRSPVVHAHVSVVTHVAIMFKGCVHMFINKYKQWKTLQTLCVALVSMMLSLTCLAAVFHANSMQQCLSKRHAASPYHSCMQHRSLEDPCFTRYVLACLVCTALHKSQHICLLFALAVLHTHPKLTCHKYLMSEGMTDVLLCVVLCWCIQATLASEVPLSCFQSDNFKIP